LKKDPLELHIVTKPTDPPDPSAGQLPGAGRSEDSVVSKFPDKSASGSHAMRRGGARREVTERVLLKSVNPKMELEGWALNLSRGGLRCILEEKVDLGGEYLVTLGDGDDVADRRARVVWVQEEPDGVIVGVEFVGLSGIHLPPGAGTAPPPKPPTIPPPPGNPTGGTEG